MKQFWKSLGLALTYFIAFLGIQVWVTLIAVIGIIIDLVNTQGFGLMMDVERFLELYLSAVVENMTLITTVSNLLTMVAVWVFFLCRHKKPHEEIGLEKTGGVNLVLALVYGFGMCFLVDLLTRILPISQAAMEEFSMQHDLLWAGDAIINFLAVAILAPVAEEFCFRGLCYTRLRRGMRPVWAMLISAALFGLAHGDPVWMLVGMAAGMALAWIFETTGSLWCCILVHMTNNTISYLTAYVPMSEVTGWILIGLAVPAFLISAYFLHRYNHRPVENPALPEPLV